MAHYFVLVIGRTTLYVKFKFITSSAFVLIIAGVCPIIYYYIQPVDNLKVLLDFALNHTDTHMLFNRLLLKPITPTQ